MNTDQKLSNVALTRWTAVIKEQAESGLNINAWCAQKSISRNSFFYWKRKLKEKAAETLLPDIVPVPSSLLVPGSTNHPNSPDTALTASPVEFQKLYKLGNLGNSSNELSVSCGGIHLSISSSVPDDIVLQLLKVVRHA